MHQSTPSQTASPLGVPSGFWKHLAQDEAFQDFAQQTTGVTGSKKLRRDWVQLRYGIVAGDTVIRKAVNAIEIRRDALGSDATGHVRNRGFESTGEILNRVADGFDPLFETARLMAQDVAAKVAELGKAPVFAPFPAPIALPIALPETPKDSTETSFEDAGKTGTLSSKSTRITTLDELLAFAKVDLDVWTCVRHIVNKWEVGTKDDKGRIVTSPLFQIKATLERRKGVEELRSITDSFIEKAEKFAPSYPKIIYPEVKDEHLWELSIPDAHIGKLCWGRECGVDYDTKIARRVFMEAVKTLLSYAQGFPCSQILLPIGNDFLNADNATNTTTGGTPQDVDSRRAHIYEAGCDLLVEAIDLCSAIAPVHVVAVSGNHDYDSTVTICAYLRAWYRNNDNVTFANEPTPRKYYRWGNSLIGFTHGNNEKMDSLPLIMATERADDWAKTKFRSWHLGHIHSEKQTRWKDIQEFNGVVVKHLPSLSGSDFWHVLKGYSGLRAAKLFAWSLEDGCKGEFTHSPK